MLHPTIHPTEVVFYVDGACSGNPGPAGLGVVMLAQGKRRERSEFLGFGTNNIAELTAIARAAEWVDDPKQPVIIYTDSQYSIGVLVGGWKAKANLELIVAVKAALRRLQHVRLVHVRGHSGHPENERADALARLAVQTSASVDF